MQHTRGQLKSEQMQMHRRKFPSNTNETSGSARGVSDAIRCHGALNPDRAVEMGPPAILRNSRANKFPDADLALGDNSREQGTRG